MGLISKFCPACDKEYQGDTAADALQMVKDHLKRNLADENHAQISEMEEWSV